MKRCCLLVVALLAGCSEPEGLPGKPNPKDKFVNPSKVTDFATLYAKNCAGCHGKDGQLGPAPPLNDSVFLTIVPDAELTNVIAAGRANTEMPAFAKSKGGTLTDEQVQALVKGLRETWGKTKAPGDWPPYVATAKGDVARGKAVFAKACAECHGPDGASKTLTIHDASFLALTSEQALRRFVITGRGDLKTKMPNCADANGPGRPLSAGDVDDVVAFMLSWK